MSRVPAEQRREQLIDATIDLAITEGLAAASVRRIADQANVSLGVVHYCFSSKEALINAVAESFATPILGPVASAIEEGQREGLSIFERGRAAFDTFWKITQESPGRQLLSYELAAWSIRGDGEAARLLYQTYLDVIESFLVQGFRLRGTPEMSTADLARMLLALADGVMLSWLVDHDSEATSKVIDLFLDAIFSLIEKAVAAGKLSVVEPSMSAGDAGA